MIDRYLRELRRRGVRDERVLAEVRAHLEDAAQEGGEAAAVEAFGPPRVIARRFRRPEWPAWLVALVFGAAIAYIDSRPTWDDTGVTAFSILVVSAAVAVLAPRHPWRWIFAVGAWLPVVEITQTGNAGSITALAFATVGALLGSLLSRGRSTPAPA